MLPNTATSGSTTTKDDSATSTPITNVGLIDLTALSMDWLRAAGDEASKAYFMHVPEQDQQDDTHFQRRGAVMVACLVVRLAVPSLQENQILNSGTTLLLGLSCGALYLIRKDYPAPKPSKLDGVVNAVLIVFALVYGLLGVWGLLQLFA